MLDEITNTTIVAGDDYVDIAELSSSDMVGVYDIGNTFYVVTKSGEIISIDRDTKKLTKLELTGDSIDGEVVSATPLARIVTIELLASNGSVYEFDTEDNSVVKKDATDNWENSVAIDSFETNLYLLSGEKSQIFKHLRTSSGYGRGAEYLDDTSSIQNPISLTIDSDIYILSPNGSITKYTAGEKQTFDISSLLVDIGEAKKIYTNPDIVSILVSTDSEIVLIGKDGKYKGRYVSDKFDNIQNIFVEENTVYVVLTIK